MKRLTKRVLVRSALVFLAVAAVAGPLSSAQEGPSKRPFTRGDRMIGAMAGAPLISIALKHKSELNLSDDQVANLEKIRSHYRSQVTPLQEQLAAGEKEIASLMQQSPANLIQIKAKIQETEKLRSELRYLRIEALENGRSVLNSQQQEQLKSLVRGGHEHFRKSKGQPS
jgi:Spy/CpxP family protein refolding chaperone